MLVSRMGVSFGHCVQKGLYGFCVHFLLLAFRVVFAVDRFHGEGFFEVLEVDEFEAAFVVFDNGGERFNPVARIEVVEGIETFVGGCVDMAANNTNAAARCRELAELTFEVVYEIDGFLDLCLHFLGKGVVVLAAPCSVLVVPAVDAHEHVVAPVAEMGEEGEPLADGVENVAVKHKVIPLGGFMNVVFHYGHARKSNGQDVGKSVVVVAAQVDDFEVFLLETAEYVAGEAGVVFGPLAAARDLPEIDNVAVENEAVATRVFKKMQSLSRLAIWRA